VIKKTIIFIDNLYIYNEMIDKIFFSLLKNIYKIRKLPIKRYTWEIEMKVLELNCEIGDFIDKYNKNMVKKNR